jgi:PE family
MTFVVAAPEMVTAAARNLSNIGSTLDVANAAAAAPTRGFWPRLGAPAAAFHEQFVQALSAGAGSYASAEAGRICSTRSMRPSWHRPGAR